MIRIGVVNIDVSHPLAFSETLRKGNRARYVAVYNDGFREEDEVNAFVQSQGLEKRCHTIEELADMVDIGFVQGCNWDKHLSQALPFLERGKPVFIDKPIVGSLEDCRKVDELAKNGAVILGSSSVRYAEEIQRFASMSEAERGKILHIYGTSGVDEFNYAIHAVEGICGLEPSSIVSARFIDRSSFGEKACETFALRFESGVNAIYNTFHNVWQPFEFVITTTKSTYQFRVDTSKIYGALLDRICDYMETGKSTLATVPVLTNAIRGMLAGKQSRDTGGAEVLLRDIHPDCAFDGYDFEKGYAAAATKIYLA